MHQRTANHFSKERARPAYRIGDLLWCREGRQSQIWWPIMITYDPKTGIYYKVAAGRVAQYHVQYFGISAVRGWVYTQAVQEFKHAEEKPLPAKGISKGKRKEFEVALEEVSEASRLERNHRKLKFIFSFPPEPTKEGCSSSTTKLHARPEPLKPEPLRTEPPRTKAPKTETSKTETPRTETPRTETPRTEVPRTEAPRTKAPRTEVPRTKAPRTKVPRTKAPRNKAPRPKTPSSVATLSGEKEESNLTPRRTKEPRTEASRTKAPRPKTPSSVATLSDIGEKEESSLTPRRTKAPRTEASRTKVPRTKTLPSKAVMSDVGEKEESSLTPMKTTAPRTEAPRTKTLSSVAAMSIVGCNEESSSTPTSSRKRKAQTVSSSLGSPEGTHRILDLQCISSPKQRVPDFVDEPLVSPVTIEKIINHAVVAEPSSLRDTAGTSQNVHMRPPSSVGMTIVWDSASRDDKEVMDLSRQPLHSRRNYRWAPPRESFDADAKKPSPAKQPALDLTEPSAVRTAEMSDCDSEVSAPASITSAILTPPSSAPDEEGPPQICFDSDIQPVLSDAATAGASGAGDETEEEEVLPRKRKRGSQSKPKRVASTSAFKSGACCICDVPDIRLLSCEGHCFRLFHLDCLGLCREPSFAFVCDECLTVSAECYACKGSSGLLLNCSRPRCSKVYHPACTKDNKLFVFDEKRRGFVCPLHHCARCTSIGLADAHQRSSELLQCVQCPLALHKPDCLVAGSELLGSGRMVCYQHRSIEQRASRSLYSHLNLNTCLECGGIGSVVCCDQCSAAYHVECLEPESCPRPDTPTWKCPSCAVHDLSTYGSMVLCKFGKWRWWPGEIIYPDAIPTNLHRKKPGKCMFVVRFCGSHDFGWTYHGRTIPYAATVEEGRGEGGGREGTGECGAMKLTGRKRNAVREGAFAKAHCEAAELYKSKLAAKEERKERCKKPESKTFYRIKFNKYLVPRPVRTWADYLPCQCTPQDPCNDESTCFNRASLFECDTDSCPLGDLCQNRRMQKLQCADTYPFYTNARGWGLKVRHNIAQGDFVVEYVGEILDTEMCRERLRRLHECHTSNFYMLTLEPGLVIDASIKSNHARFINHSCDPNCETQKWTARSETRIGIFARTDIPADTELTFDYQFDSLGNEKKRCLCGSKNCSGFLGTKQAKQPKVTSGGSKASRKRSVKSSVKSNGRKRIKRQWSAKPLPSSGGRAIQLGGDVMEEANEGEKGENSHDDECFMCGDGGTLLLCDRIGCSKAYHLHCVSRKLTPARNTRWECPRHYCKTCQKEASTSCVLCPLSYCEQHQEGKFVDSESGQKCLSNCTKTDTK